MDSTHVAVLSISIFAGIICGLLSSLTVIRMIEEINRKRPANDQISYFGSYLSKNLMVFGEYRRLYPQGHLHLRLITLVGSAAACVLLGGWALGFF